MEEKIKTILDDYGVAISDAEGEPQKVEASKAKNDKKADAKIFYDKEDLISFHQLFLSKPLVKACNDLDYEHPTVI